MNFEKTEIVTEFPSITVPYAKCGCGFEAKGLDSTATVELFNDHICPIERGEAEPTRWYSAVFSIWGVGLVALVLLLAPAVIEAWRS